MNETFEVKESWGHLMEQYFEALVAEDTVEAWAALKKEMPWRWAPSNEEKKLAKQLGLQVLDVDIYNPEEIRSLLDNSPDGTIFGDFWHEPMLEIGAGFYPHLLTCQVLLPLSKESNPNQDLTNLFRSSTAITSDDFSPISLMVIVCPRCQLRATEGDPDNEVEPEECAYDDCIACGGSGEWEFELEV
jgi:hypothetical protein